MRSKWWVSCGVMPLAMLVAGCGGQAVDVGSNGNGGNALSPGSTDQSLPPGDPLPVWPDPSACQAGAATVSGTWTGYVQGPRPVGVPDTDFKMTLAGDDAALCGTLLFGEPINFAPPKDPKIPYPGGANADLLGPVEQSIVTGYTYDLLSGTYSGRRLRLQFSWAEAWRKWCQIQTPYFHSGPGWQCAPAITYSSDANNDCQGLLPSGSLYSASCDQFTMCENEVCACDQQSCTANPVFAFNFDVVLNDATDGAQGDFDGSTVVLTKN